MKTATKQLTFVVGDNTPRFVDLAQCLSVVNRRFYSQQYLYAVESFVWRPAVAGADLDVVSIPSSWPVFNAWVKAKALWDKVNRQSGLPKRMYPKYHDFKVFFNAAHYAGAPFTGGGNLLPVDGADAAFSSTGAEWVYSQFVSGNTSPPGEDCCHMLGDDLVAANAAQATDGSFGIIQGYADTRTTVGLEEPELPGDASVSWQTNLFPEADEQTDIINHLEGFNDRPPYAHALDAQGGDNPIYVGGSESGGGGHQLAIIAPQTTETAYAPGGEVPCGLLLIQPAGAGRFIINVAPGMYNGVAAMKMGDVPT